MKILLIDIGNTTADFRLWDSQQSKLTKIIRPLTKDTQWRRSKALVNYFKNSNISFDKIVYVSVVPEWNDILRAFASNIGIDILNLRSDLKINKTDFEVDDINKLGADFISNFYGALKSHNIKNGAIVSMGTASTIAIVENKKFKGAIICPGLKNSLNCLISSAVLLKDNAYSKSNKKYGTNTVDAINTGAFNAHYTMLSSTVKNLGYEFAIFTGGNSSDFKDEIIKDNFILDEELIFKGLIELNK
ncbi:type III pantothenate kinase [Spiroplasma floricola]|uniref:Type III pantothenate kinase n=1 Tax=Spiroplasma floricola 23-6 TaxID=1336749 RepID=A0A2K8SF36_9MOLU|nr:type III pantothenate kinase [Spiroplasma floricola]AUB32051.1 type III pantothenate kinase [Spiroplasma floricola 23-6]